MFFFCLENNIERLYEHSYLCLEECVDIASANYAQSKGHNAVKLLGDSYFKLAEYAHNHQDNSSYNVSRNE